MVLSLLVAQEETRIAFDLSIHGIVAILAGVVILFFPKALNYIVAAYLIIVGAIELFNIRI